MIYQQGFPLFSVPEETKYDPFSNGPNFVPNANKKRDVVHFLILA